MQTTQPKPSRLRSRIVCIVAALVVLFLLLFGRGMLGRWARYMAARRMAVWAISDAQQWLAWAAWLMPSDGQTELMKAACYRHLGRTDRWSESVRAARQKGAPASRTQNELKLSLIESGELHGEVEQPLAALVQAGGSQQDVAAAFIHGCLARKEMEKAKALLDAWAVDAPGDAHNAYMWGVYWRQMGETAKAMKEFQTATTIEPRHELARIATAELFEKRGRSDRALQIFVELAVRSPDAESARIGLAKVLRRLSRLDDARAVLRDFASAERPSSAVSIEMGQIELECGNYEEAERWFAAAHPAELTSHDLLASVGTAVALAGRPTRADRLFTLIAERSYVTTGIEDLRARLLFEPNDRKAADEMERLSASPVDGPAIVDRISAQLTAGQKPAAEARSAVDLYSQHCRACHGQNGNGGGRAARYLFPKPRDLRTGSFRLVSTRNGVPTQEDVEAVIRRGMPGTSMPSFEDLSEDQQQLLAEEVLRIRREGIREEYIHMLKSEGEEIDACEVDAVVEHLTKPGEVVHVPRFGPTDAQTMERGRKPYFRQGCDSCHGRDGRGTAAALLFDDHRRPTRARDLVHEPFRGGHEPRAIYRRILLGMPGTPHPANKTLREEPLIALVEYCLSLSQEPKRTLTNHQRAMRATGRAYLAESPGQR